METKKKNSLETRDTLATGLRWAVVSAWRSAAYQSEARGEVLDLLVDEAAQLQLALLALGGLLVLSLCAFHTEPTG